MKLLFFTRALARARHRRFLAVDRPQALARTQCGDRVPRLHCVWSRGADGRLACRWLRDGHSAPTRITLSSASNGHVRHVRPA